MGKRLVKYASMISPALIVAALIFLYFAKGAFLPPADAGGRAVANAAAAGMPARGPSDDSLLAEANAAARAVDNPGIFLDGFKMPSLAAAAKASRPGSVIELRGVVLREAAILRDPGVTLKATGSTLYGAAAEGKAALVVRGDTTTIEGLNCFGVRVGDGNGACVRDESPNLTLRRVHFHDSQEGVLASNRAGSLTIEDSVIERNGFGGQAHNVYYSGAGSLTIRGSRILSATGEGHEVKSRASRTTILGSVIAGLEGRESRTIDVPLGGVLVIRDSVLEKGPHAENRNFIGYGLEQDLPPRPESGITLENVTLIADTAMPSLFLSLPHDRAQGSLPAPILKNVRAIGPFKTPLPSGLAYFKSRAAAKLPPYPSLPDPPRAR